MKQQIKSSLILLLTATIWGVAFVAQSVGMEYIGPFTFNAIRCVLGGLALIPVILVLKKKKETGAENQEKEDKKTLWAGGIACGVILCIASNLQQFGIMEASVGKSGFFTALYIVMIPVIGIFIGKRPGIKLWFCVALAVVGMYLLCMKDGSFTIDRADIMLLLCALAFSFHILVVDYFSPKVDGVKMSCIQFFVCGVLSAVGMLFTEIPDISNIQAAWLPLLYAGLLSCGVGYTLQIVGQKGINPVIATLIMSLESVISALAGWVILGQVLSPKDILGCVLMFVAIIITQIPIGNKKTD